jgi:phenylacetate-CoA ligase
MQQGLKQLRDIARAMRLRLRHRQLEYGSSEELEAYQDDQLKRIVRHAASHSAFLGKLYRNIDLEGDFRLQDLPIVDKRILMDHFDEWVSDPRLNLTEIERQIEIDPEEQYYLGEYRIVATSGSSGFRGIFVYDRKEWSVVIAAALRWAEMFGISPVELSYKKLASVKADKPTHATSRVGQIMGLGIRNLLMLDATEPLAALVERLNEFQPQLLMGYASLISLLAEEQIAGRLHIAPETVATFSEMLGEDRVNRADRAWGLTPFNHYGAAEQIMIAADCDAHLGLHHFADLSIVEIVDKDNRPVPTGTPGHKILLTNLHKFVQPVIRYEVTDLVTKATHDCSCTRSFPLFSQISGRTEDVLVLRGAGGKDVPISPLLIADCMIEHADIIEYQYSLDGDTLRFRVVSRVGSDRAQLKQSLRRAASSALAKQGVTGFNVEIEFVDRIIRTSDTMGKLELTGS